MATTVPVYYAVDTRRPGLAYLGFAIHTGADFLPNRTQLTEKSIEGVFGAIAARVLVAYGTLYHRCAFSGRETTDS